MGQKGEERQDQREKERAHGKTSGPSAWLSEGSPGP